MKDLAILKSGKGNGVVLICNSDYYQSLESLFSELSSLYSYHPYKNICIHYLIVGKLMKIS